MKKKRDPELRVFVIAHSFNYSRDKENIVLTSNQKDTQTMASPTGPAAASPAEKQSKKWSLKRKCALVLILVLCIIVIAGIVTFSLLPDDETDEGTVIAVILVSRHGERTRIGPLTNSSGYNATTEDETGDGQLTLRGQTEMRGLGLLVRDRYDEFFQSEGLMVTLKTADKQRCIDSATQTLNGTSYDGNYELQLDDSMLVFPKPDCPATLAIMNYTTNTDLFSDFRTRFSDLRQLALGNTSMDPLTETFATILFAENLISDALIGDLPDNISNKTIERADTFMNAFMCSLSAGLPMQQLFTPPLINDIMGFMRNATIEEPRLVIYNTHDILLDFLLRSMDSFDESKRQGYGSTIIFELRQQEDGERVVRVFHWDTESEFPGTAVVPQPCSPGEACAWRVFEANFDYLMSGDDCHSSVPLEVTRELEVCLS